MPLLGITIRLVLQCKLRCRQAKDNNVSVSDCEPVINVKLKTKKLRRKKVIILGDGVFTLVLVN